MSRHLSSSSALFFRLFKKGQAFSTGNRLRQEIKSHHPNNIEKHFLVWTGKYKTKADVPNLISYEEMERCRNRVRIRLANIMMALTVVGCIIMVYSGKQAAKRGESVSKMNLEWHKKYNEENSEKPTTN